MHNLHKYFSTTLFEVIIIIILQWSGSQSLPLHALNSERCYSHMYLTRQQIQNKLVFAAFSFSIFNFYLLQINSLSGIIIPEVFPLLSLHIKMSNTPKLNYFQCQAHVSLELRLFQPPRMAKVQSQRRICFPRTTAEKEKHSSLENYSVQTLPAWDHQIPQGCSPALLQNQVQHQLNPWLK